MVRPPQALPTPPSPINNLADRVDSPAGSLSQSLAVYQPSPQDYRASSSPLIDERHDSQQMRTSPGNWDNFQNSARSQQLYDYTHATQEYYSERLADSMGERLSICSPMMEGYNARRRYRRDHSEIQSESSRHCRGDSNEYSQSREYAQAHLEQQGFSVHPGSQPIGYMAQSLYNYTIPYGCGQNQVFHQNEHQLSQMHNVFSNYQMSPPQAASVHHPVNYSPSSQESFQQCESNILMGGHSFSPTSGRVRQNPQHSHSPLQSQSFSPNQSSSHVQQAHLSQSPVHQTSFNSSPISTPATSPTQSSATALNQAGSPPSLLRPNLSRNITDHISAGQFHDTSTEATIRVALTHRNSNTNASSTGRSEGGPNDIEDVDFVHGGLDCNIDEVIKHEMQYSDEIDFDFASGMSMYSHGHMQSYASGHREINPQIAASHTPVVPNYASTIAAGNPWVR